MLLFCCVLSSVQFSHSVMCESLRPHGWQQPGFPVPFTNSWSLVKFMSIKLVMPSNHLILCCPLLLPPSIFPSISVFSNESVLCIRWPKYWSFSFSISPSNEYSELIFFRMDWSDLLAVQGTLNSLLQHHSSKASISGIQFSFCPTLHTPIDCSKPGFPKFAETHAHQVGDVIQTSHPLSSSSPHAFNLSQNQDLFK